MNQDGLPPQFQGGAGAPGGQGQSDAEKQKEQEERKQEVEQMKNSILSQIMDQSARARLNTLMVAKPDKARAIEGMLINMARSGQMRGKIGEMELVGLLEQITEKTQTTTKVKFDRRRAALDDDDDDINYDDL